MQWTMRKHAESCKSPLEVCPRWASVARGNPADLGRCLECLGHLPLSCLHHPCVKRLRNVSLGKTNAQVYESVTGLSYPRRFMGWCLTQLLQTKPRDLLTCQHTCRHSVDIAPYSLHTLPIPHQHPPRSVRRLEEPDKAGTGVFWVWAHQVKGLQALDALQQWKQTVTGQIFQSHENSHRGTYWPSKPLLHNGLKLLKVNVFV